MMNDWNRVVYEDNHLIAVIKLPGQTVQAEPNKPESLEDEVKTYLMYKYKKEGAAFLGVIHRLDMPVGGLVLFAKTSKALTRMNEVFQKREIKKFYRAWVHHKPPANEGHLLHYIFRDDVKNFTKCFDHERKGAKKAELNYKLISRKGNTSLIEVELLTGRKHQIRAQLSAIGCPIIGDVKYGAPEPLSDKSIALESFRMEFKHPVKDELLSIELPISA